MPGAILENLSGRKLAILVSILIICQIVCFLIGGLIAPTPASAETVLATKCLDPGNNSLKWFYRRGVGSCNVISLTGFEPNEEQKLANQIVFAFQVGNTSLRNLSMGASRGTEVSVISHPPGCDRYVAAQYIVVTIFIPLPRDNTVLDYSRWQQNLIGVLQLDIKYHPDTEMARHTVITLDARLGYRNKGDSDDAWKHYASSVEERTLECTIDKKREGYIYNCSIIPLFELGSLHHDYYLLDVRLPVDDDSSMNQGLGHIVDLWLVVINQNGGFTKVWVSLKTIFFPIIVAIMVWFWNRVSQLSRSPALLEYMLMTLGGSLTFLNLPLEYLTLTFDMPYMLLLGDIRQGIFYASLLSFWLVFAGEHLMDDAEHTTLKSYWKNLSAVAVGCLSLFIFDICERGVQLRNPFYSIWVTSIGTNLALTFIILAAVSAVIYFLFLAYMIRKVFCNISAKRNILPSMSSLRRLHYEGVIYRFKFLMLATLLCAAMTVIGFILGQISEGHWKWDEDIQLEYTSAFFTGVYGMWNIYIFALLVLYAPSHKQWPSESEQHGSVNEEIEFSRLPTEPSEISSLASFTRKAAMD